MLGFSQLSKPIKWQDLLEKGKNGCNALRTSAKIHFNEKKYFGVRCTLRALRTSFNMCPCIPDRIGILAVVFEERGKSEYTEKNLLEQGENQQQTQPTYDAGTGNRTRVTLVGGECFHHCATPAPLKNTFAKQ